jgi:phosphoglycolate phosphatase-like HAD superfamily hydrolase
LERSRQLEDACAAVGVPPPATLFCGDKFSDLLAGRRLGMFTVIVGKKGRKEWAPDVLLDDVGELRELLQ